MSRKSAVGWNLVCCCFFINLSGKGYINILRMGRESSGNGDCVFVCLCVCVCCDPQCKEQALQLFLLDF